MTTPIEWPSLEDCDRMARIIHGPVLRRYRHVYGASRPTVDRVDPTSFEKLTPAERRGVLMAIAALRRQADDKAEGELL